MLDILTRSIARAAGVEVPDNVRIVEPTAPHPSIFRRIAGAVERWNVRRSTYLTLKALDDHLLTDIGLYRGMLHEVADDISWAAANDNELPVALSQLAANDNDIRARASSV